MPASSLRASNPFDALSVPAADVGWIIPLVSGCSSLRLRATHRKVHPAKTHCAATFCRPRRQPCSRHRIALNQTTTLRYDPIKRRCRLACSQRGRVRMAQATLTNRMRLDNHSRGHDPAHRRNASFGNSDCRLPVRWRRDFRRQKSGCRRVPSPGRGRIGLLSATTHRANEASACIATRYRAESTFGASRQR